MSEKVIITDEQIMNLIVREVYFQATGFDISDIRNNPEESLETFGIEEETLIELETGLGDGLVDFGVEEPVNLDLSVNLCILDIFCKIKGLLEGMDGIVVVEVEDIGDC